MSKKQQKVLKRIVVALLLLIAVSILDALVEMPWILRLALYLVPYLVIGYDILKKAGKGILKRQVFDENFLMAVATIGAVCLGEFKEGAAVMLFYQIGELFHSRRKEPQEHRSPYGYPTGLCQYDGGRQTGKGRSG
jgi:Cd2+/Zn2+-exporting ATPase